MHKEHLSLFVIYLLLMLKTVVLLKNHDSLFFQDSLMNRNVKKQHLFEIEMFCNNVKVLRSLLINLIHSC